MSDNNKQKVNDGLAKVRRLIGECVAEQSTYLDLSHCSITDLNDLPELLKCTQLKLLDLENNNISDLTLLAGLTGLTTLYLSDNNIGDLTSLSALLGLAYLSLSDNNISDLTPLAALTGLVKLVLNNNNISELAPLTNLNKLQVLDLEHNNICVVPKAMANIRLDYDLSIFSTKEAIRLGQNPITTPPPEILKQGRQAFIDWYAA